MNMAAKKKVVTTVTTTTTTTIETVDDTNITIVMDCSGSMATIAAAMRRGVNSFMREQKTLPGKCTVSLIEFNSDARVVYEGKDIAVVQELDLRPSGYTALFDGVDLGIKTAQKYPAKKQIVVIVTDGEENSSRFASASQIKSRIADLTQGTDPWAFMYFGVSENTFAAAASLGISASNVMSYDASAVGVQNATDHISKGTMAYRSNTRSATSLFGKPDK